MVEAVQLTIDTFQEVYDFIGEQKPFREAKIGGIDTDYTFKIRTLEGNMTVSLGDYIIKEPFDTERKFYPCKPHIFERTYIKVED